MRWQTQLLRGTGLIGASSLLALAGLLASSLAVKWIVITVASAIHAAGIAYFTRGTSAAMRHPHTASRPAPPVQQELSLY